MNTETSTMNETSQPGELLKIEREKRGVTTKQIAIALNLPERFIIYLEAGELNQLPGHTFARGYIRNYGKYLELDNVEDLVALFDRQTEGDEKESKVLDFKQIKQIKNISNSIYWLISFVFCLVLAGIAFLIWQNYMDSKTTTTRSTSGAPVIVEPTQNTSSDSRTVQSTIPLGTDTSTATTGQEGHSDQQATDIPESEIRASSPNVNTVNTTEQNTQAVTTANTTAAEQPVVASTPVAAGEGRLQVAFKSNCWVSVTDATGKVLVNKLFAGNTNLDITGKAPLEVVIGAPNAVSVTYNGEAVKIDAKPGSTHHIKLGQ